MSASPHIFEPVIDDKGVVSVDLESGARVRMVYSYAATPAHVEALRDFLNAVGPEKFLQELRRVNQQMPGIFFEIR